MLETATKSDYALIIYTFPSSFCSLLIFYISHVSFKFFSLLSSFFSVVILLLYMFFVCSLYAKHTRLKYEPIRKIIYFKFKIMCGNDKTEIVQDYEISEDYWTK